jgi:hypothetical protein
MINALGLRPSEFILATWAKATVFLDSIFLIMKIAAHDHSYSM